MAESYLSAFSLRNILDFDPATGIFKRRNSNVACGKISTKGYRQIYVSGRLYAAHRLAWLHVFGEWPSGQIDHINQIKDDNRISNLRVVTNKQNQENITKYSHNISGRRGVRWRQDQEIWIAEIKQNKKQFHIGSYLTIVDAVAARMRTERVLFTHSPFEIPHLSPINANLPMKTVQAPGTN